ncbi:MAG: VPLPA-CTERM sorting domain-containing protein [Pseudomonadota bacterium]
MSRFLLALASAAALVPAAALSSTVWDEAVYGDLSGDPDAPTALVFSTGSNVISGSVSAGEGDTRDFITFTIGENQVLTALLQLEYVDPLTGEPANRGFHAINEGDTSFIPGGDTADFFLGGAHLDPLPEGTDMLSILAAAPQAGQGFDGPLGPGTYSYVIQQTGPQVSGYTIDFQVAAVPVPAGIWLIGSALFSLAGLRRRHARGAA